MADLATLGVVVTTKGVTEADRQLNSLSASGKKAESAATGVERSFKKAGISAGQLQNATRQLPAQFTDIAVGLSSGQRPLQVLLQQGGQIKDAFGGAGLALRAMVGYVTSLISPVTVLAAVALGLAVAWKQGSDEAVEFNKALILTGNYAGTTSDALALAAQRMDDLGSTQRSASAALTAVAGTGRIAREQLETVALAAEQMRIATGKSIDDTVAEFVRLQGDPVKAILKLNETQNFLTLEIYDQIKALQDQGREQDAAALATETYANTINDRTRDIRQSLGFLERSWLDVKQAAAEAWDEILGVGRTDAAGRIQNIDRQLDQLRNGSLASQTNFGAFIAETAVEGIRDIRGGGREARIRALIQERQQIQDEISRADSEAAKKAAQQRLQQQTIAFEAELATYATAEEKRAKQIIAIRGEADQLIAQAQAQGNDALVQRLEAGAAKAIAAIEAQGAKKPKKERVDNSAKREAERLAREAAKAEEELNKIVRQNAADLGGPAAQAARQYADELLNLVGVEQALAAAGKLTADRERELAIARQQASDLYAEQLQDIEDKRTESARQVIEDLEFELKLMGLSNVEREKMIALRYANADAASEEGQKIGSLIEQINAEREKIASQDFLRGEVKGLFQDLIDGSKSAKEAFADFVDSVLAGIAEIIAKRLTEQLLGDFGTTQTGAAGGGIASFFAGLFSGGRAIGGPVSGNKLYGIAEKGPEVLDIRGKKYLIPGADGNVTPMREGQGGGSQHIQQNLYVTGTVDARSAYQIQREAQLELRMAVSR